MAYAFATGVRIGPHDFSGGIHGAAGVLRKLGFEVRDTRNPARQQAETRACPGGPVRPHAPAPAPARGDPQPSFSSLDGVDPQRSLLVLTCSGRKDSGGRPPGPDDAVAWPQDLRDAEVRVLATARADTAHVLPAWRRYTGTFYQHARPALADAVAAGHVVIISGGYGIARADEPIGWYDKALQLADWPGGLLDRPSSAKPAAAAHRPWWRSLRPPPTTPSCCGAPLAAGRHRRAPGHHHGRYRRRHERGTQQLGQAFSAFWNRQYDSDPPGTTVEPLR